MRRATTRTPLLEQAPVRLLVITEFFPDWERGGITGGVECRCWYLAKNLSDRFDMSVLANMTDGSQWDYASAGSLPRRALFLVKTLVRGLRTEFDLVEGTNLVTYPVAWLVGRLRGRPVVFWYPDVLIGTRFTRSRAVSWLGEAVERLILRLPVSRFIAISEATAAKLRARGVPPSKVTVVPCGFDPQLVDSVRMGGEPEPFRLCVVARLVPYKRTDLAIQLVSSLRNRHPDVSLTIVGRGPEWERLHGLAASLCVEDRVQFTGYVREHVDVLGIIARSSLFIMPSEVEGFGIALAEAMALGVPYVASHLPVVKEVTDGGRGGRLFRTGDLADLARHVDELLADPESRMELGKVGREVAQRYRWHEVGRQTEDVYIQVLASHAEIQESL